MIKRPRRPRWPATPHTLFKAHMRAARLTAAEVAQIMSTLHPAAEHILAGVGSRAHWAALAGACTMAQAIEAQGIVRGLAGHLALAEGSLNAIAARAEVLAPAPTASHAATPTWHPTPLRFDERDNIALLLDLVKYQLEQLSAGELAAATARAQARVMQAGGHRCNAAPCPRPARAGQRHGQRQRQRAHRPPGPHQRAHGRSRLAGVAQPQEARWRGRQREF